MDFNRVTCGPDFVMDKKGDLLADSHSTLNSLENT
jgi:hypothetical protein